MKKRGLIISTLVMVVVLAIAITTATYAWFMATAEVEVQNVSVRTVATEGLEVAVRTSGEFGTQGGTFAWGDMTNWEGTVFTGANLGFGSFVNFQGVSAALGAMEYAITDLFDQGDKQAQDKYIEDHGGFWAIAVGTPETVEALFQAGSLFVPSITGVTGRMVAASDGVWGDGDWDEPPTVGFDADTTYYIVAEIGATRFIRPIAYTDNVVPVGFVAANVNDCYMFLPIAVRATDSDITAITVDITITPEQGEMMFELMPGMAAASRIEVRTSAGVHIFNPWGEMVINDPGTPNYLAWDGQDWVFSFLLAEGAIITQNFIFDFEVTIWIDGEDANSRQATAGSGFVVDIEFNFVNESSIGAQYTTGAAEAINAALTVRAQG